MKQLTLSCTCGRRFWFILWLALAIMAAGCQGAAEPPVAAPATGGSSFAGVIPDTNRFVALVSNGRNARAYVCDGETVAEWFSGDVTNGTLDLTSAGGARLQATLDQAGASGTFTPAGGPAAAFTAEPVRAPAGLYRAERNIDGVDYVGGWIVLPDGQTQGAIRVVGDNPIITARRAISIPFGTLHGVGTAVFSTELGDFQATPVEVAP
jgi:hypothetical protein